MGRQDAGEPRPRARVRHRAEREQEEEVGGGQLSSAAPPGRVLGVDLGIKRTGLAVSDELRLTTRALPTLTPGSRAQDVAHLVALCEELDVKDVVVGHPTLPRSGDEGGMARRARGFADALRDALAGRGVAVHLVDETGTSKEAASRLAETGVKRSRRKAALDGEAARVMIEAFVLDSPSS